jgi:hypothetical protein
MRLSPERFNALLGNLGQTFHWRKSNACPCVDPRSGAARVSCKRCGGKGRVWSDPVVSTAGVTGRDSMRQFQQFGILDAGDVMLVIPEDQPLYDVGEFDRVMMLNRTEPFSMNVVRNLNEALRFSVVAIDRVYWLDADENEVDGDLPTVNDDGSLTWVGEVPPTGKTYSITGRRHPEYFCYLALPLDRPHHFGARLPRRVVLRRFDLYGR